MATFAADTDLLEYEPQIRDYGIHNFSDLHEKTYTDIIRLLNIKWWPTQQYGTNDISAVGGNLKLTNSKLNANQFVRAAVYHVLAYYIYPRLSTFDPDGDAFTNKMNYYKSRFEEEFDLILRDGVHYDLDSSGTFTDAEKQSFHMGRLVR